MAKITELIPGQIWESESGEKREVMASGPTMFVTRTVEDSRVATWGSISTRDFQRGLALMHRLVRPRVKKWTVLWSFGESKIIYQSSQLYDTVEDAQNYSRHQGLRTIAIVPVEFAEGDNLPQ